MKLLVRLYNWLSDKDPYAKYREHKSRKLFLNSNPDFMLWAFGDTYESMDINGKVNAWNRLHGDRLIIEQVDHLEDYICKMGMMWTDHVAAASK